MLARSIRLGAALAAIGLAALALPAPGFAAEDFAAGEGAAAVATIPCLCRFDGQSYAQGECACLPTSAGPRRACCGKVLNNSSWMFKGGNCALADNGPKPGDGDSQMAGRAGPNQ